MFVLRHLPCNEEALLSTKDLRGRMHKQIGDMKSRWEGSADLKVAFNVWDVEGMYPSMPKQLVRKAMREILKEVVASAPPCADSEGRTLRSQHTCFTVPKHRKDLDVEWGPAYNSEEYMTLTVEDLLLGWSDLGD